MFKIIKYFLAVALLITVALGIQGLSMAMTVEEATADIEKKAADKGYTAKEVKHATETLTHLMEEGIPVEHACEVVMEALEKGIKGKEMREAAHEYSEAVSSEGLSHKEAMETMCPSCPMSDHTMDHRMDTDVTDHQMDHSMDHDMGISGDNIGSGARH